MILTLVRAPLVVQDIDGNRNLRMNQNTYVVWLYWWTWESERVVHTLLPTWTICKIHNMYRTYLPTLPIDNLVTVCVVSVQTTIPLLALPTTQPTTQPTRNAINTVITPSRSHIPHPTSHIYATTTPSRCISNCSSRSGVTPGTSSTGTPVLLLTNRLHSCPAGLMPAEAWASATSRVRSRR